MTPPGAHFAGRTGTKSRSGLSRGLKRLLTTMSQARPKSKSRPNTLTLFDIVSLNFATRSAPNRNSRLSICYEPGSSTPRSNNARASAPALQPAPQPRPVRKPRGPLMADRVVDVRLESLYDEEDSFRGYVFAAALQDAWHAQEIQSSSSSSRY